MIAGDFGISTGLGGTIVSATQAGYGFGLCLLVPLADRIENRKLILGLMAATGIALLGMSAAGNATTYILSTMLVGLCATSARVVLPLVAHLTPPARRGRVIGNVMAGVLSGIMLARPLSSFIASGWGWRAVFLSSAALFLAMVVMLARWLPRRQPESELSYGRTLISMAVLLWDRPELRRRCLYQGLMFCAYSLFWTACPFMLAEQMGLDQNGIGLFALAGAGGALAAPFAGRMADQGKAGLIMSGSMLAIAVAFVLTIVAVPAGAVLVMGVLGISIDADVQAMQIVNQRFIFSGPADSRGRVNAVFATLTFVGGAMGSSLATMSYKLGGWTWTGAIGCGIGLVLMTVRVYVVSRVRDTA